jgi:uncharacterized membrane protein YbhN (UPF0104 family)
VAHPLLAIPAVAAAALVWVAVRRARGPLSRLRGQIAQGGAIFRTPGRYLREVAAVQAAAWSCRVAVAFFLLQAFGLPASVPLAIVVVVASGLSTLVPVPGGAGAQQALLVYALHQTVSTAAALSFSIGMQVAITTANTLVALAALMLLFRTLTPVSALRAARTARRQD